MNKAEREVYYLKGLINNIEDQILLIQKTESNLKSTNKTLAEWLDDNKDIRRNTSDHSRLFNNLYTLASYDTDIKKTTIKDLKGDVIFKCRNVGRKTGILFNELVKDIS